MAEGASFGRLIKARRRALDLTQEELARQVAYSVITIRKIEADERRPSRQLAEALARGLGIAAEERPAFVAFARAGPGSASQSDEPAGPGAPTLSPPTRPPAFAPAQAPGPSAAAPGAAADGVGAGSAGRDSAGGRPATNLPAPLTRLIGRDGECATVRAILLRDAVRLVTLVGPPGIGKSRLGIQVAGSVPAEFPGGVYFVPLAPVRDPALVAPTVAKALGVREQVGRPLVDRLTDFLHPRRVLLLLDDCEHMLAAAPLIADLLTACPGLTVLATSRAPLHLRGERLFPVPPLSLPDPAGEIGARAALRSAAVGLFLERAQDADPDFRLTDANAPHVATVCTQLDGLPLAIELVAARTRLMTSEDLAARIGHRLALLTDGPLDLPPRQQTLRGTIDWSYALLDAGEQALFARLAVFNRGFPAPAAAEVTGGDPPVPVADGLAALVTKNLLVQEERADGERHYLYLETIREYALERLAAGGEEAEIRDRHAAYYLRLAEAAGPHLTSQDQQQWLDRLESARDNLRAALEWYVHRGATGSGLRLVAALWKFWHIRSRHTEGHLWMTMVLEPEAECADDVRARALHGAGWIALDRNDLALAEAYFTGSLAIFRKLRDTYGEAEALQGVGICAESRGESAVAASHFSESLQLHRARHDDEGVAWSLDHLGNARLNMGDDCGADALFAESLSIFDRLGHTWGAAICRHHLGLTALSRRETGRARGYLHESLALFQELDNAWGIATSYDHLGYAALLAGDHPDAYGHFQTALARNHAEHDRDGFARSLAGLASLAVRQRRPEAAARLFGAAEAMAGGMMIRMNPVAQSLYETDTAAVRAALDPATLDRAWSAGRASTAHQALAAEADPAR